MNSMEEKGEIHEDATSNVCEVTMSLTVHYRDVHPRQPYYSSQFSSKRPIKVNRHAATNNPCK